MTDEPGGILQVSQEGAVMVARFDDGKANALSHSALDELGAAVATASSEAAALVILGRPGRFSAGFDLSVMGGGAVAARDLLHKGALLFLRIYAAPIPVVLGCTGHALAGGAILLMSADWRVGAAGDFKIGLNEVAIGMPVPKFATELARDRLSSRHFTAATTHARIFDPGGAIDAGYLDEVVDAGAVDDQALSEATRLATTLNPAAFRMTRDNTRGALARRLEAELDADMALFDVG